MKYLKFVGYLLWAIALFGGSAGDFTFGGLLTLVVIGFIFYMLPTWLSSDNSNSNNGKEEPYIVSIDGKKIKKDKIEKQEEQIPDDVMSKVVMSNGNVYEGEHKNGKLNGKGTCIDSEGQKYVGEFVDDKPEGYGILTFNNKDKRTTYQGEFVNWKFNGHGKLEYVDGDSYEGEWKNDHMHGEGIFKWKNGDKYDGEWFQGTKHGIGTEYYKDGSYWSGEWIKNEQFKGKWTYPKKKTKKKPMDRDRIPHEVPEDEYDYRVVNQDLQWLGNGSGFFISKNGYITTNYHVIKDANKISAEFLYNDEIETFKVKIIRDDRLNDLAILKIDDKKFKGFKSLPYSIKKSTCDVGTEVYALGYPAALGVFGKDLKFTDGKISAKSGFKGDITKYQTTVPIHGGNSGGPLFDDKGNLVGINSSKLEGADNVTYAIKSGYLVQFIDALPQNVPLPSSRSLNGKKQTEQIKVLSNFVPLIKVA